ncbi:MAG: hypothetical protein ACRBBN_12685 [Methyloligellaceae bacterium]
MAKEYDIKAGIEAAQYGITQVPLRSPTTSETIYARDAENEEADPAYSTYPTHHLHPAPSSPQFWQRYLKLTIALQAFRHPSWVQVSFLDSCIKESYNTQAHISK